MWLFLLENSPVDQQEAFKHREERFAVFRLSGYKDDSAVENLAK